MGGRPRRHRARRWLLAAPGRPRGAGRAAVAPQPGHARPGDRARHRLASLAEQLALPPPPPVAPPPTPADPPARASPSGPPTCVRAALSGSATSWTPACTQMVGAGAGLTPSGDDALCAVLLVLRGVGADGAHTLVRAAVSAAAHRTTSLSASLLHAAAEGYAVPAVADLVRAVLCDDPAAGGPALAAVLAIGHSSGRDLVAGIAGALHVLAAPPAPSVPPPWRSVNPLEGETRDRSRRRAPRRLLRLREPDAGVTCRGADRGRRCRARRHGHRAQHRHAHRHGLHARRGGRPQRPARGHPRRRRRRGEGRAGRARRGPGRAQGRRRQRPAASATRPPPRTIGSAVARRGRQPRRSSRCPGRNAVVEALDAVHPGCR